MAFALAALLWLAASGQGTAPYDLIVEQEWLVLSDGTRLAATIYRPVARAGEERFPVLLELLPYRKDDLYLARDYPLHSWFARRGFISARVDIRGTGSSGGVLPDREYSERELSDAREVIERLAAWPGANGAVGMWGISWSGFAALQVGQNPPPALKAILVAHASEDLYRDDSHFIDGLPAVSWYELTIDHWNGLPSPADYATDGTYFAGRFDREPWILQKFRHPRDSAWWRAGRRGPLAIPAYMIGGLHDGYRDAVLRVAADAEAPVIAEIGPWGHSWPNTGGPGPAHEWGERAVRWWNHWLRGDDTGILDDPPLAMFVRSGAVTDSATGTTPGEWRWADLPYQPAGLLTFEAVAPRRLRPAGSGEPAPRAAESLAQDPASGTNSGLLWWEVPADMRRDDAGALTYDGAPVADPIVIAGIATARLQIGAGDCAAHWIVRLEDVRPDGRVDFVTGGAGGGCEATASAPDQTTLTIPLRFATWTFRPGHRIRLAVTNAQFPMVWPSPRPHTSLVLGSNATRIELPRPRLRPGRGPVWPAPQRRDPTPGLERVESDAPAYSRVVRDRYAGTVSVEEAWGEARRFGARQWFDRIAYAHRVHEREPANATFEGEARFAAILDGRSVEVITTLTVESDVSWFTVIFERRLFVDGASARTRTWRERFGR